jgi:hypothetical protein
MRNFAPATSDRIEGRSNYLAYAKGRIVILDVGSCLVLDQLFEGF